MFRISLMHRKCFYAINLITFYRLLAAPLLIFLILSDRQQAFAWMLAISLFTDLIDGLFARRFKVTSIFGSKLDSIADDLTFLAAIAGTFAFKLDFILHYKIWVIVLLALYFGQILLALLKYGKISSFHTYMAKTGAVFQGLFFVFLFLLPEPIYPLFVLASIVTILELLEEIILVLLLNTWKANVKGLWWIFQTGQLIDNSNHRLINKQEARLQMSKKS